MNLLRFWDWIRDENHLTIGSHKGKVIGGLFNYQSRSFCVDLTYNDSSFRVVCSSKDGHLEFTVREPSKDDSTVSLRKEIEEHLKSFTEPRNRMLVGA